MLQQMGVPGVPVAGGSLQNISRLAFGDTGQAVLQPKLINPHQEMNPRINENNTKLVNKGKKEKKRGKKADSAACRTIPFNCADAEG